MDNKKIIGQRINSALAISGKMQKDLAAVLGVTDNTVSYYVGGKRSPSTEQLIEIAKYLGVSADYLLGLSDTPSPDIEDQAICRKIGCTGKTLKVLKYIFGTERAMIRGTGEIISMDTSVTENQEYLNNIQLFFEKAANTSSLDFTNFFEKLSECVLLRVDADRNIFERDKLINKINSELSEGSEIIATDSIIGIKTSDPSDHDLFMNYKDKIEALCSKTSKSADYRDVSEYRLRQALVGILKEMAKEWQA